MNAGKGTHFQANDSALVGETVRIKKRCCIIQLAVVFLNVILLYSVITVLRLLKKNKWFM